MVKISNAPLALDKIGQCLKFKQSGKSWNIENCKTARGAGLFY